jgi:hypothetical protein
MAKVRLAGDSAGFVELSAPATAGNNTLTLPDSNGSLGQTLITDGSGTLSWNDVLLTSGNTISGSLVFNDSVTFVSGLVSSGAVSLNAQNPVRFYDSDSSNYVAFQAPATIVSNVTWILPSVDGSTNQFLSTDGAGTLSWDTPPQALTKGMSYFYAGF